MTLLELMEQESETAARTRRNYNAFANHADIVTVLLSNFILSAKSDREIFSRYFALLKKHHTLALFSTLRLHQVQAAMNLRQALETGVKCAYALANPDPSQHLRFAKNGSVEIPNNLRDAPNRWLNEHAKEGSEVIKRIKRQINETMSHANLTNSHAVFINTPGKPFFDMPFFDIEDEYHQKIHLWQNANLGLLLIDLISWSNTVAGGLVVREGALGEFRGLISINRGLEDELKQSERFTEAQKLQSSTE